MVPGAGRFDRALVAAWVGLAIVALGAGVSYAILIDLATAATTAATAARLGRRAAVAAGLGFSVVPVHVVVAAWLQCRQLRRGTSGGRADALRFIVRTYTVLEVVVAFVLLAAYWSAYSAVG